MHRVRTPRALASRPLKSPLRAESCREATPETRSPAPRGSSLLRSAGGTRADARRPRGSFQAQGPEDRSTFSRHRPLKGPGGSTRTQQGPSFPLHTGVRLREQKCSPEAGRRPGPVLWLRVQWGRRFNTMLWPQRQKSRGGARGEAAVAGTPSAGRGRASPLMVPCAPGHARGAGGQGHGGRGQPTAPTMCRKRLFFYKEECLFHKWSWEHWTASCRRRPWATSLTRHRGRLGTDGRPK